MENAPRQMSVWTFLETNYSEFRKKLANVPNGTVNSILVRSYWNSQSALYSIEIEMKRNEVTASCAQQLEKNFKTVEVDYLDSYKGRRGQWIITGNGLKLGEKPNKLPLPYFPGKISVGGARFLWSLFDISRSDGSEWQNTETSGIRKISEQLTIKRRIREDGMGDPELMATGHSSDGAFISPLVTTGYEETF